mmetsp:Transcript_31683/g.57714  ORF Transcript_31683/g.57714 Transcript_31683/m.57714 type:complete len:575 (+) Transcript_31683:72-1796(+)
MLQDNTDAFGADWMRDDLPFARNKKEFRNFEEFDKALRAAQSDNKGELTRNINEAAKVAMSLSSSSGIKHVVRRLCLVSKDPRMHKETPVYVIDSLMRHADKEKNEELRERYERHIQLHLRNLFKRAIRSEGTRSHLADKFLHKILPKWKEKGWFANDIKTIVDVIDKAAPDIEKPDELNDDVVKEDEEYEPSPMEVPQTRDRGWLLGRAGATAKAGAPPTPAQPAYLGAPGTPGPDGLPMASPQVKNILLSVPATPNVLNSVPATPTAMMGMSVPATPAVGNIPQTPMPGGRVPQTPMGNAGLGMLGMRIPQTPAAAPAPMTPAGGGVLLTIPQTPGVAQKVPQTPVIGRIPSTPGAGMMTPGAGRIPTTPGAPGARVPATPVGGNIPATPMMQIPMTPAKQESAPATPSGAFGGQPAMAMAPPFTPGLQPFSSRPSRAMPSTPKGLQAKAEDQELEQPEPSEGSEVPTVPSVEQPVPSVEQPVPTAEVPSIEQPVPSVEQPVPSIGASGAQPGLPADEVPTLSVPQPSEELTADVPSAPSSGPSSVPSAGSEAKRRRLTVKHGDQSGRGQEK